MAVASPFRIGPVTVDPPLLQAPMAGFTNYAFREIVRDYGGVGLLATEMVSARSFAWLDQDGADHPDRLWGVRDEPRPLAVQMWDNDPETLARVGQVLARDYGVSVVDLNFGCPVKQVTDRAHSGSYLLRDPDRIGQIVGRVVEACRPTPVTAKIRLGTCTDNITAWDVVQAVEGAGAAAVTVHGRTARQFFRGHADWDRIAELKQALHAIPLIGNGDLDSSEAVVRAFGEYGVDGVMIARACLGRPWLFRQAAAAIEGRPIPAEPTPLEQQSCLRRHLELVLQRFGERKGTMLMRKYACCYAQGRRGAREFRRAVSTAATSDTLRQLIDHRFPGVGTAATAGTR